MLRRLIRRDRPTLFAAVSGAALFGFLLGHTLLEGEARIDSQMLTEKPWYCEVDDPGGLSLVARTIETFHTDGASEGLTRLEDRESGRLLLEFTYRGQWHLEEALLTEAISDYQYLHVDDAAFSEGALTAIEAEFAEPEVSRIHRITPSRLVYGVEDFIYQCHRPV